MQFGPMAIKGGAYAWVAGGRRVGKNIGQHAGVLCACCYAPLPVRVIHRQPLAKGMVVWSVATDDQAAVMSCARGADCYSGNWCRTWPPPSPR